MRATLLFDDIGEVISEHYRDTTDATASLDDPDVFYFAPPFNFREALDQDLDVFTSWQDYYGPEERAMNLTSISRYNLDDSCYLGFNISNYGNLTQITPQVFQPDDIVLVQDGDCGSTCTVFTEFMKSRAKVKQIIFGGRRQNGPMQGVGNVKGAQVLGFDDLCQAPQLGLNFADPADQITFQEKYGNLNISFAQAKNRNIIDGANIFQPGHIKTSDMETKPSSLCSSSTKPQTVDCFTRSVPQYRMKKLGMLHMLPPGAMGVVSLEVLDIPRGLQIALSPIFHQTKRGISLERRD